MRVLVLLFVELAIVCIANAGPASHQRGSPERPHVGGQIIGGEDAPPGDRPFQVSIQDLEYGTPYHLCGGTIYSTDTIITSATCVYGEPPNRLQIVAGEYNFLVEEGNEQTIQVDEIIPHPNYDVFTFSNDIALLKLRFHLSLTQYVQTVFLPPPSFVPSGECVVSGWGSSHIDDENMSDTLQKVTLPIIPKSECNAVLAGLGFGDLANVFCAGYQESGKNACIGDDGGPLTCVHEGHRYLAGVLSFDHGCNADHYPGVYVEVQHYKSWIDKQQ